MRDGLEHRAEIAVPVSSRRKFMRTAAVTAGAGLLSAGMRVSAQGTAAKAGVAPRCLGGAPGNDDTGDFR